LLFIAGGSLTIGAFLTWVQARALFITVGIPGIDGDGKFTAAAGLLIAFAAWKRHEGGHVSRGWATGCLIAALLSVAICVSVVARLGSVETSVEDFSASASPGIGLLVTGVGGVIGVAGAVRLRRELEARPPLSPEPIPGDRPDQPPPIERAGDDVSEAGDTPPPRM
jgi:hypothetical protein